MAKPISDYSKGEFIQHLETLLAACATAPDDELADLLEQFEELTGHPDGSDLIFYPEPGATATAEGITETVSRWREANGLPTFKPQ